MARRPNDMPARKRWGGYVLLLPALALLTTFALAPILYGGYLSLFRWDGFNAPIYIGFDNYTRLLLHDDIARQALANTVIFAAITVVALNVLGLVIALLLNRALRAVTFFRTAIFLPVVLSSVVVGLIWNGFYNPVFGVLNETLQAVGLELWTRSWLSDSGTALLSVTVVQVWKWTGIHMVLYLAGLQAISGEVTDAARIDGAGSWHRFWYITLPLLAPVTFILNGAFVRSFDLVRVMTGGGPDHTTEVVLTHMVTQAFAFTNLGYATAIGYTLCLFTAALCGLYFAYARGGKLKY
jgi:ABC-type sugar transport system permease subunit